MLVEAESFVKLAQATQTDSNVVAQLQRIRVFGAEDLLIQRQKCYVIL